MWWWSVATMSDTGQPPRMARPTGSMRWKTAISTCHACTFSVEFPYPDFVRILQVSAVHIYLTVPFVLSWSALRGNGRRLRDSRFAHGAGSRSHRAREERLVGGTSSPDEIADQVDRVLDHPDRMQAMRAAARNTILQRYDLKNARNSRSN